MKKLLLLLLTTALFFNCGSSGDGSDDEDIIEEVTSTSSFFEDIGSDDTALLVTEDDTYEFKNYKTLVDEDSNYKSILISNGLDTDAALTFSFFYDSDTGEIDRLSIGLNILPTSFYSYSNSVFLDGDPQDITYIIEEDSGTRFKASFSGVLSNLLNNDGDYDTINITNAVIDIEL